MMELGAKFFYSVLLLGIAIFCLYATWQVWFDRSLQYGRFVATMDGADAVSTADAFRRLIVQQQNILYELYKGSETAKEGDFRVGDILRIQPADLGQIHASSLDDLKIEAAGVNVTSLLSTLRRWIAAPNEITGSVDQIGDSLYVSAEWASAPRRDGSGTESRTFSLPTQTSIGNASFELACRIFLTRIAPGQPTLTAAREDDFCVFSNAALIFRDYVAARDRATTDDERKAAAAKLTQVQHLVDGLVATQTSFPYAYKLAAYLAIERSSALPPDETESIARQLDQAQQRLTDYGLLLAKLGAQADDPDARERLAYLARRRGMLTGAQSPAQSSTVAALAVAVAAEPADFAEPHDDPPRLEPGASIGREEKGAAATLCCFVKNAAGRRFLVTAEHGIAGPDQAGAVVSPAMIDRAKSRHRLGDVVSAGTDVALVAIPDDVSITNGPIRGLAPSPELGASVEVIGRTSGTVPGNVTEVDATATIGTSKDSERQFKGLVLIKGSYLPGDGGGPVLDGDGRLIGLLLAGSNTAGLVLPLEPIFKQQGLELLPAE